MNNTPDMKLDVYSLAEYTAGNKAITDSIGMTYAMLQKYQHPMCSISGGADSDIIMDLCVRLDVDKKVRYVWFNTGMEYQATKRHLDYLEHRYGVKIERVPPIKSIPQCCKEYGQPFISKYVSQCISSLQNRGFKWEDKSYEVLLEEYPGCQSRIAWWCNKNKRYCYNIKYNKWLKEFLIAHPPVFKVNPKCCEYAKKKPSVSFAKDNGCDLQIIGIRQAEGGIRSSLQSCYAEQTSPAKFYPIFWYGNTDKADYGRLFGISNSDCYTVWGLKRTGCVGCPFNRKAFNELDVIKKNEPGMWKAANSVFGESYEYTRLYREFAGRHNSGDKTLNLFKEEGTE